MRRNPCLCRPTVNASAYALGRIAPQGLRDAAFGMLGRFLSIGVILTALAGLLVGSLRFLWPRSTAAVGGEELIIEWRYWEGLS